MRNTKGNLAEIASLAEVNRSLNVPKNGTWFRKFLAFAGPGYMVAVGYMDPGNWATDIAGGSQFGYTLLSVILISNLMVPSCCRPYPASSALPQVKIWLKCAVKPTVARSRSAYGFYAKSLLQPWICTEVIGSAIALKLLFGIPLLYGVLITAFDVMLILLLQNKGFRALETLVIVLMVTIAGCFGINLILAQPEWSGVLGGFVPDSQILTNPSMLYIAIGIMGATVMPHNLYLHSSIVQTRKFEQTSAGKREAIKFATWDSSIALMFALFINAAILIVVRSRVPYSRKNRCGGNQRCFLFAVAIARNHTREYPVRGGAARFRSEFNRNRYLSRANRHGGLSQPSSRALAAPSGDPTHCYHSSGNRHSYRG